MSKHTAIRRSTLVSSIAMLLVAVMALSGATYAWFSSGNTADAQGIALTATTASGLYIVNDSTHTSSSTYTAPETGWVNSIDFDADADTANTSFNPVSTSWQTFKPTFYTAKSVSDTGVHDGTITQVNQSANNYLVYRFFVKGDAQNQNLNCTVNLTARKDANGDPLGNGLKGYERVALVNATDAPTDLTLGTNAWIFATGKESGYSYDGLSGTSGSTVSIAPLAANTSFVIDSDYDGEATCFYLYVWFEGQDETCKNANAAASFNVSVDFSVTANA